MGWAWSCRPTPGWTWPTCNTPTSRAPISSPRPSASDPDPVVREPGSDHRFGYIALVGRPNAGKSTLFNTFLGQRLSIVTARPQTTRGRILGILTRPTSQLVVLDTPGLLEPSYRLHESMARQIQRAVADADVVVLLLDATRPDDRADLVASFLAGNRKPLMPVLNKIDRLDADQVEAVLATWRQRFGLADLLPLSALKGINLGFLLQRLEAQVPTGAPLYPAHMIAQQPERFFAAELIRESAFEQLGDELPYAIQVEVDQFREPAAGEARKTYVHATIYVERDSQKGIVIGKKGARLRHIGTASRAKVEALIGGPLYLELRVRVRPDWRRRPRDLTEFGYL